MGRSQDELLNKFKSGGAARRLSLAVSLQIRERKARTACAWEIDSGKGRIALEPAPQRCAADPKKLASLPECDQLKFSGMICVHAKDGHKCNNKKEGWIASKQSTLDKDAEID
jgi:hypothetical protein